jgi:hypothetical protein
MSRMLHGRSLFLFPHVWHHLGTAVENKVVKLWYKSSENYHQMSQGGTMTYVFELDILLFNLKLDRYIGVIQLVLYLWQLLRHKVYLYILCIKIKIWPQRFLQHCSHSYMSGLAFYSHIENTYMTASFHIWEKMGAFDERHRSFFSLSWSGKSSFQKERTT